MPDKAKTDADGSGITTNMAAKVFKYKISFHLFLWCNLSGGNCVYCG